jgi:hypothetical protein
VRRHDKPQLRRPEFIVIKNTGTEILSKAADIPAGKIDVDKVLVLITIMVKESKLRCHGVLGVEF